MNIHPAIPVTNPTVEFINPASPRYPPISITKDPTNNLQNTPPATAVQAAKIK
jgi:hypothetical protein